MIVNTLLLHLGLKFVTFSVDQIVTFRIKSCYIRVMCLLHLALLLHLAVIQMLHCTPYIFYSKFKHFIWVFFRFYDVFCSVRTKLYPPGVVKSLYLVPNLLFFSCPAVGRLPANFEPRSCRFRTFMFEKNVSVSSSTGAVFEPRSCQF